MGDGVGVEQGPSVGGEAACGGGEEGDEVRQVEGVAVVVAGVLEVAGTGEAKGGGFVLRRGCGFDWALTRAI